MAEILEPQRPQHKFRRKFKLLDLFIFIIILVVVAALSVTLISKLHLKHEVAAARSVSDRVITDIAAEKAADARSLGDAKFQSAHSTTQLKQLFASANGVAKGHALVDRQTVSNAKTLQVVNIIYKYNTKPPYFIRVAVSKTASEPKWQLIGISGNSSEAQLIIK